MATPKLKILPSGLSPKTYTIGHVLGKKAFRDTRFAPEMTFREAEWLLENELRLAIREREPQKPGRNLQ